MCIIAKQKALGGGVLGIKGRVWGILGQHIATEPHLQS